MNMTVDEYCVKFGLSRVSVYKHINSGKIESFKEDKRRFIVVNEDDVKGVNKDNKVVDNAVYRDYDKLEIESLKGEIKQKDILIKNKDEEIRELYNRLIKSERDSKEEIKYINKVKDDRLREFMELIERSSSNLLMNKKDNSKNESVKEYKNSDDVIDIDINPEKKYLSLKEFKRKYKLSKDEVLRFVKIRLKKEDDRFIRDGNGGVNILDDDYSDLM